MHIFEARNRLNSPYTLIMQHWRRR